MPFGAVERYYREAFETSAPRKERSIFLYEFWNLA